MIQKTALEHHIIGPAIGITLETGFNREAFAKTVVRRVIYMFKLRDPQ